MTVVDLYFAGYLIAAGYPVTHMERDGYGRTIWHFQLEADQSKRLQSDWLSDKGEVSARGMADAIRAIKNFAHEERVRDRFDPQIERRRPAKRY